jgi:glycosyltransferase involved in cell wall biosynthesis
VVDDQKLRNNLIKLGFKQVKMFSWGKTVKETLKIYEKALKQ